VVVSKNNILIIADKGTLRESLGKRLSFLGYNVYLAVNSSHTLTFFPLDNFDLVLFDATLDNYEFCQTLKRTLKIPLISLLEPTKFINSAERKLTDADGYILKPIFPQKLETQIFDCVNYFHNQPTIQSTLNPKPFYVKDLTIELDSRKVLKRGHKITLTNLEFSLLKFLLKNAEIIVSRNTILQEVWGYIPKRAVDSRVVDVYISRLRLKLEDEPTNPSIILTFRDMGYMFQL
jgi:OmpR family response regulator RpaB